MIMENYSLDQLLEEQLKRIEEKNFYAMALSKSQSGNYCPTVHTFQLLHSIYSRFGDGWLEVVRRVICHNYDFGFSLLREIPHFYRPLITELFHYGSPKHFQDITLLIDQFIGHSHEQNSNQFRVAFETVNVYLKMLILEGQNKVPHFYLHAALKLLGNNRQKIDTVLSKFCSLRYIDRERKDIERMLSMNSLKVVSRFCQLIGVVQDLSIRSLTFRNLFKDITLLCQMLMKHVNSMIDQLKNVQLASRNSQKQNCSLIFAINFAVKSTCLKTFISFEDRHIAEVIAQIPIYDSSDLQQMHALNVEIHDRNYSPTRFSVFCMLIDSLAQYLPGFTTHFVEIIANLITQSSRNNFCDVMMKFCISRPAIIQREDLKQKVKKVVPVILQKWENSQWLQNLQILRFIALYYSILNEETICMCFSICMKTLRDSSINKFIYQETKSIVEFFASSNSVSQVLKVNIGTIVNQLLLLPDNQQSTFEIMLTYLSKFKSACERSSEQLINFCALALQKEVQKVWTHHRKTSQLILKILYTLQIILEQDIDFQSTYELIPLLNEYLERTQRIEFQDELLKIVQQLIQLAQYMTPEICQILTNMEKVFIKNNNKLTILSPIYYAISKKPKVVQQIMYEYEDLLIYMLRIVVDYFSKFQYEEFVLYQAEISELFNILMMFLQVYEQFLREKCQTYLKAWLEYLDLIPCHQNIILCEHVLQVKLTIAHILLDQHSLVNVYSMIRKYGLEHYRYRYTYKMVVIVVGDWLHFHPQDHEQTFKTLKEWLLPWNKKEKHPYQKDWPFNRIQPKQHFEQLLRNLKVRNCIDKMEHAQYLTFFKVI